MLSDDAATVTIQLRCDIARRQRRPAATVADTRPAQALVPHRRMYKRNGGRVCTCTSISSMPFTILSTQPLHLPFPHLSIHLPFPHLYACIPHLLTTPPILLNTDHAVPAPFYSMRCYITLQVHGRHGGVSARHARRGGARRGTPAARNSISLGRPPVAHRPLSRV